jgi:hypothetical protein
VAAHSGYDLSALHAGSTLSDTFTISDTPLIGDTAPVILAFGDPADDSPISLLAMITVTNGTPTGYAVLFSELIFTNLSGKTTPLKHKEHRSDGGCLREMRVLSMRLFRRSPRWFSFDF